MSSFYGEYSDNRFEKTDEVISVPSSPEKSPINLDDSDGSEVTFNRFVNPFCKQMIKDNGGGVFGEKFKPITNRSKKILGKIKMNLKQSDKHEEVRSISFDSLYEQMFP